MRCLVILSLLFVTACGGRELGWLVPRASVGLVLRRTESGTDTTAYVGLGAPLSGPEPRALRDSEGPRRAIHLLARGPRCRLAVLCRWELSTRTRVITELTEEQEP